MEVMTKKEAISLLKLAKAEIEWEYPLDYQLALFGVLQMFFSFTLTQVTLPKKQE